MFKEQKFELEFAGRKVKVEVGKMANQTNASCLVSYGDTMVLATAVMGKDPKSDYDFFPLQIEVREKMFAAGKIKGSRFVKREGRPSDNSVLDGRMIDRGIRPLFNQEIRNEVQIVITTLSYDDENSFNILSIIAASLALEISDIPWNGPLVGICVGRVNGEFIVNPTVAQLEQSDLKLVFSIQGEKVLMVDAEGKEVPEADMIKAFEFGILQAQPLLKFVESIKKEIGLPKKDENALVEEAQGKGKVPLSEKKAVFEEAKKFFEPQLEKYLFNQPVGTKRERKAIAKVLLDQFVETLKEQEKDEEIISYVKNNFESYLEEEVTKAILDREQRVDGRKLNQIRSLKAEVGILPRTHGSALFSRGETQVLSVVTLGAPGDAQMLDELLENDTIKRYMHHYNCAPFSFGEAGPFRGPGRREIGHGALAEKALIPVLPTKEEFPYTILVSSEVMGSNGSSSMASTCGSTLSLLDAGVPLKRPVAGIAMGLASDANRFKVLTDLQDLEDGEGGMDFKITGTSEGITAVQMDTKTSGISMDICRQTFAQAREARVQILEVMAQTIPEPKAMSQYAPRIVSLRIDPAKIKDVIGTGGKIINKIIEECGGVQIDIEDDGLVMVTGTDAAGVAKAIDWVERLTKEVEVGQIYKGTVVRLMDFGAFVEVLPGKDGLVHISELAATRVDKVTDVVNIGDEVNVKVIEIDNQGRVNLSIKKAAPDYDPSTDIRSERSDRGPRPGGDRGGFRGGDRGGRPRFGGNR